MIHVKWTQQRPSAMKMAHLGSIGIQLLIMPAILWTIGCGDPTKGCPHSVRLFNSIRGANDA
jgi:hypothetical protein